MLVKLFTNSFDDNAEDYSSIEMSSDDYNKTLLQIKTWFEDHQKHFERLTGEETLYDIDDNLLITVNGNFIAAYTNNVFPFPDYIRIKEIKGNFILTGLSDVKNLKSAPRVVGHNLSISHCENLTSLYGGPYKVGCAFYCKHNKKLLSLKSGPKAVGTNYICTECGIRSLDGCPTLINGNFECNNNPLTNLDGGPLIVLGSYYCNNCKLTTLSGCAIQVAELSCEHNNIREIDSEVGFPKYIDSSLNLSYNNIEYVNLDKSVRILGPINLHDAFNIKKDRDSVNESFKNSIADLEQILYI